MRRFFLLVCLLGVTPVCFAALFGSSLDKPERIPDDQITKFKGSAQWDGGSFLPPNGDFTVSLYNGTDWNVVDLYIVLRANGEDRKFKLSHTERQGVEFYESGAVKNFGKEVKVPAKPLTSTDFKVDIGTFLVGVKTNWSWNIEKAYGYKD